MDRHGGGRSCSGWRLLGSSTSRAGASGRRSRRSSSTAPPLRTARWSWSASCAWTSCTCSSTSSPPHLTCGDGVPQVATDVVDRQPQVGGDGLDSREEIILSRDKEPRHNLTAVSSFWAGVLDGSVDAEDDWHIVRGKTRGQTIRVTLPGTDTCRWYREPAPPAERAISRMDTKIGGRPHHVRGSRRDHEGGRDGDASGRPEIWASFRGR